MNFRLPDFFTLGAPKAGTTSLFNYVAQHPNVFSSKFKETRFFLDDRIYKRGEEDMLSRFYKGANSYELICDGTPAYLANSNIVAPRIQELYRNHAEPKFIVVLRNPVDRAWSNFLHRKRNLVEKMTFENAIADELNRRKSEPTAIFKRYVEGGMYGEQLERWFSYFPRENFKILFYEDMTRSMSDALSEIFEFLGLNRNVDINTDKKYNTASQPRSSLIYKILLNLPPVVGKLYRSLMPRHLQKEVRTRLRHSLMKSQDRSKIPVMSLNTRESLLNIYSSDMEKLSSLLGQKIPSWS